MSSKLQIHSVKILKGKAEKPYEVVIKYTEFFEDGSKSEANPTYDRIPHNDFLQVLKSMRIHLALLGDMVTESVATDEETIEKFHVHGFSITGEKADGFILKGHRKTSRGNVGFNTPNIRIQQDEEKGYQLIGDIEEKLTLGQKEASEYIRGKHAPDPQQSLPFGDDEKVTKMKIAEPLMQTSVGSRLPKADPEAMKAVAEMPNTPEKIVKEIVSEVNGKKVKKVKQTAENKSGVIEE